jgi:hypothetical protein
MPAWRARERLRDIINGDEGTSFSLVHDWINRVEKADETNSTYILGLRQHTRIDLRLYSSRLDQLDREYTSYGPFMHLIARTLDLNTTLHSLLQLELMPRTVSFLLPRL